MSVLSLSTNTITNILLIDNAEIRYNINITQKILNREKKEIMAVNSK